MPLRSANPITTTPTRRISVGLARLGTTTGRPARARRPGAVPIANVRQERRREQRRARGERVDLDGLGEAAGEEERGGAEERGPPVGVGARLPVIEAESTPEAHRQRRRPAGDPRREPREAGAEEDHHDGDRDHQHRGELGRHRHRSRRSRRGRRRRWRSRRSGRRRRRARAHGGASAAPRRPAAGRHWKAAESAEDETADQGRAGGHAGGEAEQQGDERGRPG